MAVYKWTRRATKYFGDVWVPLAQVHLQKTDKSFQAFILQVDSGAMVSLLRRSVADLLGLDWASGREVELVGVGGGRTTARVHEVVTRFDDGMLGPIPYAIADNERTPNLLGGLGVFDPLQVDFDGTTHETRISGMWLSNADLRLYDFLLSVDRHVMERWPELDWPDSVKEASRRLVQRAAQSFASCTALLKMHKTFDAIIFVRIMFDLAAQFEYLIRDPNQRASRATQYLDYEHITKHRHSSAIAENPTGLISHFVAKSPLRDEGQPRNQQEYDRVKRRYLKPRPRDQDDVHDKWYCMSMWKLAEEIGWSSEYRQWFALGSGWAHGDPFFCKGSFPMSLESGSVWLVFCAHYYARVLLRVTEKMVLTHEQYATLKKLAEEIS